MTDKTLPTALPTRQAAAIEGRSKRLTVTGKLRVTIEAMIWGPCLEQNRCKGRYSRQQPAVRAAESTRHRFPQRRTGDAADVTACGQRPPPQYVAQKSPNHMASVAAIKTLESLAEASEQHLGGGQRQTPGVVIQIVQPAAAPKVADMPLIRIDQPGMLSTAD
jgi:hypothetical protein